MIKWLEHSWNMTIWCMGHEWIIWNLDNDYFCWHCWQLCRIHNTQANIPSNADFCRVNLHCWVCPELVIMSEEHDDQPWDEIGWDWASTWDNPNWPGHQKQIQLNQHQNSKFIYRMELTLALLRQVSNCQTYRPWYGCGSKVSLHFLEDQSVGSNSSITFQSKGWTFERTY